MKIQRQLRKAEESVIQKINLKKLSRKKQEEQSECRFEMSIKEAGLLL